jgi:transcription antitermination factor NusG
MIVSRKWYAVYTKPRWEKKVDGLLKKKDITSYCPLNRVQRQWSDRKKIIYEPLFRSYVFVYLNLTEFTEVKATDGVIQFVHWLNKPAIIKDEEIEVIKKFLNEHMNVELERAEISVNDVVRIINGPLMEQEGSILAIDPKRVKVYLPTLGYMMVVEVERSNIELVKKI